MFGPLTKEFGTESLFFRAMSILVYAGLIFAAAPAYALESNGCEDYREPNINIKQLIVAPRYNDTFALADIRALANQGGTNITSTSHDTPVGLTAASLKLDTRYEVNLTISPEDRTVCAQITDMNLSFGFDDTTVFIASEIPNGSCSYHTVLQHELQHVKTDRLLVDVTMPVLPTYLRTALRQIGVVRASSPQAAELHLKNAVSEYMQGMGANLSQVRRDQQAAIDTEDEYNRISTSCDGALSDLIATSRGK